MKKILKRTAVGFLATMCMAACAVGVAFAAPDKTVTASAATDSNLQMIKGASIYLNENSGLRFGYTVANYDETAAKNYGMLIVPYDYLKKAEITAGADVDYVTALNAAYAAEKIPYAPIVKENITPELEDGEYVVKHSVVDIIPQNYVREFFGIGFEKTGETYTYAVGNDNVRSVFEVANLALNEYEADTLPADEKQLITDNKTTVDNYITEGFDFVYSSATLANSYANAEAYSPLSLKKQEGKENIDLTSQMHFTYENTDNTVATVDEEGMIKPLKYGTTTVTYSLGGVKEITQEVKILASKAQAMLANSASQNATFNDDGSITLPVSHHYNGTGKDMGKINAEYVAFKGDYGAGTAIDITFTGNNMPIIKAFADTINGKISNQDGNGAAAPNAGTAALIMNGSYDEDGGGNLLKTDELLIHDDLFGAYPMASTTIANGYMTYQKVVPEFTQAKLIENSTKEYKITVALSESAGYKAVELFFYEKEGNDWTLLNQVGSPLTMDYTGTNIVILPGFVGAWDEDMEVRAKNTFTVSEPYSYTQTNAGVYATGTTYVKNDDGSYTFDLTRFYSANNENIDAGVNSIVFADKKYGIGTYVDIEVAYNKNGAVLPSVKMFAQTMKGELSTSGLYLTARNYNGNGGYGVYYGNEGTASTQKWVPASATDPDHYVPLGWPTKPSGGATPEKHIYSVGTYVNDEGNVVVDIKIYNITNSGQTSTLYVEKLLDTGVAEADWFAAGGIVITPLPLTKTGTATTETYTCTIRQK